MKRIELIIVTIGVLAMCIGCPTAFYNDDFADDDDTQISIDEKLFEEKENASGGKIVRFFLNDPQYITPKGFTLWKVEEKSYEEYFTKASAVLSKISGNSLAGYGIVLCQGEREGYGSTMLTVMINAEGFYAAGKVINGSYKKITPWTYSNALVKGYGTENKLDISFNISTNEYSITINNIKDSLFKFIDISEPVHTGGKSGYVAVISPQDKFPQLPVEVLFNKN